LLRKQRKTLGGYFILPHLVGLNTFAFGPYVASEAITTDDTVIGI